MNRIYSIALVFLIALFISSIYFSSKYLLLRELQLNEEVLITNLILFSYCKKKKCEADFQDILLKQNEMIYERYVELENEIRSPFYGILTRGSMVYIYPLYAKYDRFKTSAEMARLYEKLGCGMKGEYC